MYLLDMIAIEKTKKKKKKEIRENIFLCEDYHTLKEAEQVAVYTNSNAILQQKIISNAFYSKNHSQCIFIIK